MTQELMLIDGSSYLFRAYHALPPLTNTAGEPTGAIYGVVSMLRKLLADNKTKNIAMIFDPKGKNFRDDLYPAYKANRKETPDDLVAQIKPLFEIITALGFPLVIVDGYEADDVIATLAKQATEQGLKVLISTNDKDLAQLVNDNITLINTMTNKIMDHDGVIEKFGVPPSAIIDYLILVGDSVDNVPGVPSVGPKTAAKWLQQYGTLDNIIAHASEIKGKVGDNLRNTIPQFEVSRLLISLKYDVAMPFQVSDLCLSTPQKTKLIELYRRFEFKTWLAELLADDSCVAATSQEACYDTILDEQHFSTWLEQLQNAELFAFDTETNGLDYMEADLIGVSFAITANKAAYCPVGHDYEGAPKQLSRDYVLAKLKPLLENEKQIKVGQNLKFDMSILARYDIELKGGVFDTMLESYVLNSTSNQHDMDTLALKHLGFKTVTFEEIAGKGAKQKTFNQIDLAQASHYAAEDADITLQLHLKLWPKLKTIETLKNIFEKIEIPLYPILSKMERRGVLVDKHLLKQQSLHMTNRISEIQNEAYIQANQIFNLNSPKQLREILFEQQGLPVLKKTPEGDPSTAEAVLEELADDYQLPKLILEHRRLSKLKSTYADRLPEQINQHTGRVHTSYHQAITSTGRLSSSDPNLQNIPIRHEAGRQIRQAFIAPKGYKLVAIDYSQIELRIMAHLAKDPGLLQAFAKGWDIHRATAAEVFGSSLDEVSDENRRRAKAINFGLIYGMSAFGLAKQLGIEKNDAQNYINLYFTRYPKVKLYMDETRKQAHANGFVATIMGRRLYLPEINARNHMRMQAAERAAINAPMQGSAADIIKMAMIRIDQWLRQNKPDVFMIMQVHDELVFEVAEYQLEQVVPKLEQLMCEDIGLEVPLVVATGIGSNWDQAH